MPANLTATHLLLFLNVAVFLIMEYVLPNNEAVWRAMPLYLPENANFRLWQYVSSMFTHGSLSHLFMNMFGLFSFGSLLERIWGAKRFVIFYFAVGIGSGLIYSAVNTWEYRSAASALVEAGMPQSSLDQIPEAENIPEYADTLVARNSTVVERIGIEPLEELFTIYLTPVVGASGAIYGILTAFGLLFPNAKLSLIFLPVPVAAKYFIPVLLLLDLFSGITGFSIFGGGIAHFAHLGGALIGFLLMMLWRKDLSIPERGTAGVVTLEDESGY
ncbi:MAG: rhomboid family intramembrane serine protease [Kiritimatiellae bacterium]|jgi:membrane associated rhomboid family serine protease|nr:rhomboid family intramembrane serine protease [Kiritimatiellia bacterium]